MPIVQANDQSFEAEVLHSELPVLIDLYAEWCQPCKQMAPLLEELARKHAGKLKVVQVDIDQSPTVAQTFRVQSIPMFLLFKGGQMVNYHLGVLDRAGLDKLVEAALPRSADEMMPAELAQLLGVGRAVAVDIRDAVTYGRYHVPQAVNLPKEQVLERARELLPVDGRIRVLYSRSSDDAKELSEQLRAQGVEVAFLAGGFLNWEADGLPVERT